MRKLSVFESMTMNGYFAGPNGDMSWAHDSSGDDETQEMVRRNASTPGVLLFGRKTYEMMVSYWPTPQAKQDDPIVAKGMNEAEKIVFSHTLDNVDWQNTTLRKGDLQKEVRALKEQGGKDLVILGSGSLVAQLTEAGLIDEYQIVMKPVVLGGGQTLFGGVRGRLGLRLTDSRTMGNGSVVLRYAPAG
jgi:dihydrofolate reductase